MDQKYFNTNNSLHINNDNCLKFLKSQVSKTFAKISLKIFKFFYVIEDRVLKKRDEQRLEAAQMKCLRHLLGITKLDKGKNQCIRQKNGSTEHNKGNITVPEKVVTTFTEDGHKQTAKTSTTI